MVSIMSDSSNEEEKLSVAAIRARLEGATLGRRPILPPKISSPHGISSPVRKRSDSLQPNVASHDVVPKSPKLPPHRNHSNGSLPVLRPKPPIAPKPLQLSKIGPPAPPTNIIVDMEQDDGAASETLSPLTPVDDNVARTDSQVIHNAMELPPPVPSHSCQSSPSHKGSHAEMCEASTSNQQTVEDDSRGAEENKTTLIPSVKVTQKRLDEGELEILRPNTLAATDHRPISTASTLSSASADVSDSGSCDEGSSGLPVLRRDHLHPNDLMTPGSGQRRSSSFGALDSTKHDQVMAELRRNGIVRNSSRKPQSDVCTNGSTIYQSQGNGISSTGIPADIGRMRPGAARRNLNTTTSSTGSTLSSESDRTVSMLSDVSRASTVADSETEDFPVHKYETGDKAEDTRLWQLHSAAKELYTTQKTFVKYLRNMIVLPSYVKNYINDSSWMEQHGEFLNVIKDQLQLLLNFHEILLDNFTDKMMSWDSRHPDMSEVLCKKADFLKMCVTFLSQKADFADNIKRLRENFRTTFHTALEAFEMYTCNWGPGSMASQLDFVHQNFMRYKLLMLNYRKYLLEDSDEYASTQDIINKLEKIAQEVNKKIGLPTGMELVKLYDRFQGGFNVFQAGRRLLKQGEVIKQSRNTQQPRFLVLFSDVLWICRVSSGPVTIGPFDNGRSYVLHLASLTIGSPAHEELEQQLIVYARKKSFILVFKNRRERDDWRREVENAIKEAISQKKRRKSIATGVARRESKASVVDLRKSVRSLTELPAVEGGENVLRPAALRDVTISQGEDSSGSSLPSTPVTSNDDPSFPPAAFVARRSDRAPVWIPDDYSTRCLMKDCGSEFSIINRRHHCRDCGFLICGSCMGQAPVAKCGFKKENVCPECYDEICNLYRKGRLFPDDWIVPTTSSSGELTNKIIMKKGKKNKTILVDPRELFCSPLNAHLKRGDVFYRMQDNNVVFSRVHFSTSSNTKERERFAELTDQMILKFFAASFDVVADEQYPLFGYDMAEEDREGGGTIFRLVHHNQIASGAPSHQILLRVEDKSAAKWSSALRNGLLPPKEQEKEEVSTSQSATTED